MSTAPPAAVEVCRPAPVELKDVERELDRQLKAAQGPGEAPVVRARMSNLVVYTDRQDLCDFVTDQIPDIVAIHPTRVLLLQVDPGMTGTGVAASVLTRVHNVSKGLRGFSELVTLRSSPSSSAKLPFAVRRLLIGDLPTNLWWAVPQPPVMAGTILYELAEDVSQVIYDSYGWTEPARGLTATASWLERFERGLVTGHHRIASDITWRRLRPWRRLIAEALDPASSPGALESLSEISFDHGPHSVTSAWSLASWMILHLGWKVAGVKVRPGVEIAWQLTSPAGPRLMRIRRMSTGPRGIHWVRINCSVNGVAGALNLSPVADRRLEIKPEGFPGGSRTVTLTLQSPAELIAHQLSDRSRDPVFRSAMTVAQDLAIQVMKQT